MCQRGEIIHAENEGLSGYFCNKLSATGRCAGADERNISPLEAEL